MSYETAKTIKYVINKIEAREYLLPSIQREFVWKPRQIERLFDSLMVGYPIATFLFWEVPEEKTQNFQFYEFLKNYSEKDATHNPAADVNGAGPVTAILDGQQRLTSLYIGLKGTYAYKIPYKKYSDPKAYPARRLYLDLLNPSGEEDENYCFRFLTEEEAKKENAEKENGMRTAYWFQVGKVLNFKEIYDVTEYLTDAGLNGPVTDVPKEGIKFANKTLSRLYKAIHDTGTISYYLEESEDLDRVLNIFIRVNSGGTALNYSDLLLSFATAQWKHGNARQAIYDFVDQLNAVGRGFRVGKEMVLKAGLVLCDIPDIAFKVENFNKKNTWEIEDRWQELTEAVRLAVELAASWGFSGENVTSNYLFIPLACYIQSVGSPSNFITSGTYEKGRAAMKKWFTASLLRRVFSYSPDGVLRPIRQCIKDNPGAFPLAQIADRFKGTNRDIRFSSDDAENLLWTKYGSGDALVVLSVLYPWADLKNGFHIDHLHPRSRFTPKRLADAGVPEGDISFCQKNADYLGNLQLLSGADNVSKSDQPFVDWLNEKYPDKTARAVFMERHYIPDTDLSLANYKTFFTEREKLLAAALKKELL